MSSTYFFHLNKPNFISLAEKKESAITYVCNHCLTLDLDKTKKKKK